MSAVRFPEAERYIYLLQSLQNGPGSHPASYAVDRGIFSRGQSSRHMKLSSTERMNEWSYTSTQYVFIMYTDNFNFYVTSTE